MRTRAPDLADQYIGATTEAEPVACSANQGDTLDRCNTL